MAVSKQSSTNICADAYALMAWIIWRCRIVVMVGGLSSHWEKSLASSNLVGATKHAGIAQLVRVPVCQSGSCGFKSHYPLKELSLGLVMSTRRGSNPGDRIKSPGHNHFATGRFIVLMIRYLSRRSFLRLVLREISDSN